MSSRADEIKKQLVESLKKDGVDAGNFAKDFIFGGDAPALPSDPKPVLPPPGSVGASSFEKGAKMSGITVEESRPVTTETTVPVPQETPVVETVPAEQPEPFLKANDKTVYLDRDAAIEGINRKDEYIAELRRQNELIRAEAESIKRRNEEMLRSFESSRTQQTTLAGETDMEGIPGGAKVVERAKQAEYKYDKISEDQFWDKWDENPKSTMMNVIRETVSSEIREILGAYLPEESEDLRFLREKKQLLDKLDTLKTTEVVALIHKNAIYGQLDLEYPDFAGAWYLENMQSQEESKRAISQVFYNTLLEVGSDPGFKSKFGIENFDEFTGTPDGFMVASREALSRMSSRLSSGTAQATSRESMPAVEEQHTTASPPMLTREQAEEMARIAVEDSRKRDALRSLGDRPSAKSEEVKLQWTPEAIQKNPTAFRDWLKQQGQNVPSLSILGKRT